MSKGKVGLRGRRTGQVGRSGGITKSTYLGAQIDQKLFAELESYANERDLKITEVVRRSIRKLLGRKT
jgi:hypothetical protein